MPFQLFYIFYTVRFYPLDGRASESVTLSSTADAGFYRTWLTPQYIVKKDALWRIRNESMENSPALSTAPAMYGPTQTRPIPSHPDQPSCIVKLLT